MITPIWMQRFAAAAAAAAAGGSFIPGTPKAKALAFGTAYQADDKTKPAFISVVVDVNQVITLAGTISDEVELRIGPDASVVAATNPTGIAVARFKRSVKGISVAIGMEVGSAGQLSSPLPVGWYYGIRRVGGTLATISGSCIQPLT